MTIARRLAPQAATDLVPAFVFHRGTGATMCRHCHHPIRRYRGVGWVDTTPAFYGGCYDMCDATMSGQHEPA